MLTCEKVRLLLMDGWKQKDIATKLGVTPAYVSQVKKQAIQRTIGVGREKCTRCAQSFPTQGKMRICEECKKKNRQHYYANTKRKAALTPSSK